MPIPAPSILELDAASDTAPQGDGRTSDPGPVINGTGVAGDDVQLFANGVLVGAATVVADGTWSAQASTLSEGSYAITAMQTDGVTTSVLSDPLDITIIPVPPGTPDLPASSDSGASNTDDLTNVATPVITGAGEDGDTVTLLDNNIPIGTGTVTAGAWSIPAALNEGANSLTATQTDLAGDTSVISAALAVTLDGTALPPAGLTLASDSGSSSADDLTNIANPVFTGTGEDGAIITLLNGTTPIGTGTVINGAWSITATTALSEGVNSITATQTDVAGNISPVSVALPVTLDSTAPAVPAFSIGSVITNTDMPLVSGTGEDGATVSLLDSGTAIGTATVTGGTWSSSPTVTLSEGANSITVMQTDTAGNVSAASAPINIFDIPAPLAHISTTDFSSADLGAALGQGGSLAFISGTEAVLLTDATLSVGLDTNEATIQRLYEGLLGRSSDTGGISFFDAQLTAGVDKATIATNILNSAEYSAIHGTLTDQQFVSSLYQGMLGRSADLDGVTFWNGLLAQGISRGAVATDFAESDEAKSHLAPTTAQVYVRNAAGTLLHELFETGLGREVDLAALLYYKTAYLAQTTPSQLAASIAGSSEFAADHAAQSNAAYVNNLFQAGLGRPADPEGSAFWTGQLNSSGATRGDVLLGIATSGEAATYQTHDLST